MATIFTRWISRRKERRAKKAAVVRGEALTSVGVTSSTPRTTTGGYATSSGEVHVSSGGNITYSGGGGGSSGGGGGSSTQTTTTTQTATPTTSTSQLLTSSQQSALKKVTTQQDLLNRNKIYNPYTNTYQTSAYGNYDDSTAISRIPSINEQIKIDEANKKGDVGYQITGYSTQDYRDLANQQNKIVSYSEKISIVKKDLDKELNRFNTDWKGYIKNNEFVGNQKEYQIYKESYNKLNRDINKYNTKLAKLKGNLNLYSLSGGSISKEGYLEMPKVNIGGVKVKGKQILKGKNVSLNKFRGLYTGGTGSQIVSTVKALSKTGSVIAGESIGKGLGEKKKYVIAKSKLIPEKTIKGIYQPQFGTATNYDKYGNAIPKYKNVKVKAHKTPELYFTGAQAGESIGNVLNVAGQAGLVLGSYELAGSFVPRGGEILFAGQAAGEVNKAGGVKQFVKEHPAQAALTGAVVLGGGLFAGSKALKGLEAGKVSKQLEKLSNRPVKYFEFVNEPSSQMYLRGFQEYGGLKREINVVGRLAKTEKGFKLIPEARG
ncbi:MAG TPA: hypothetical protein ENG87_05010, partial [Candidatus Pacearchaeota archaeon]|nr:hypothetical protein [Candidatus Pacearchaeota archaeon]